MKKIRYIYKYATLYLSALNTKGYGVHSPYIFHLIRNILRQTEPYYVFRQIESLRFNMSRNKQYINVVDYGTGKNRMEKIGDIVQKASKPSKQAQLLFRLVHYLKAKKVLELGSSVGITTAYLASSSSDIECITIEGCPNVSSLAVQNFQLLGLNNISMVNERIEEALPKVLEANGQQDFVFIDANHRYEALMYYFEEILKYSHEKTVFVLDDIYWSKGMERAWKEIKNDARVSATIDVFYMGIVFLDPNLQKKNYKVRF